MEEINGFPLSFWGLWFRPGKVWIDHTLENWSYFCCFLWAETSAEPSLQAKQLKLKRARLADDLNEKIAQRPGPMELVEKNILPVESSLKEAIIGKAGRQERAIGSSSQYVHCGLDS